MTFGNSEQERIDTVVMVDMTPYFLESACDCPSIIDTHLQLLNECSRKNTPVISVVTDKTDRQGRLQRQFYKVRTRRTIKKDGMNGFEGTSLDEELKKLDAKNVLVTGLYLGQCVDATAHGARQRGYVPLVVSCLTQFQSGYETEESPVSRLPEHTLTLTQVLMRLKEH